jgi:hypothetical protein
MTSGYDTKGRGNKRKNRQSELYEHLSVIKRHRMGENICK